MMVYSFSLKKWKSLGEFMLDFFMGHENLDCAFSFKSLGSLWESTLEKVTQVPLDIMGTLENPLTTE